MRVFTRLVVLLIVTGCLLAGCDAAGDMEGGDQDPDPVKDTEPDPDLGVIPTGIELVGQIDLDGAGQSITDVWGYVDPATGIEYALVAGFGLSGEIGNLYIVDVSDPADPKLAATVPDVPGFDVKTYRRYAYTVTGGPDSGDEPEGRIIDLTDPTQPEVVGAFPSAHNVFISEAGQAYLEIPELRIFDLSQDPLSPALLWERSSRGGHDATVVGDRLYDFMGSGTGIYDVSDPASPVLMGTVIHPQISFHHSGWPTSEGRYLYICDEGARGAQPDITVWDISRPEAPARVALIADPVATVHNLIIVGNVAYVSYYTSGFRVYDVSDPAQPRLIDEHDTAPDFADESFAGAWGVYPFAPSGNVYVSDRQNGLLIFSMIRE